MDLWPLLTEDLLTGTYSVERQLRPRTTAVAIRSDSLSDARDAITTLCARWGGGFSPLVSVGPGADKLDDRTEEVLLGCNIDGIEGRDLLPDDYIKRNSDRWANASQYLLRQLAYLNYRPNVQTCRNVSLENPWYASYLATFGDIPDTVDVDRNRINDLRDDLSFPDLVDTNPVNGELSFSELISRLRALDRVTAVSLSRVRLPTSMGGGYNKGLPSSSRFSWGQSRIGTQYGPNILVIYEAGSVNDLALVWNLRARFAHPNKLPLAIPLTEHTKRDIALVAQLQEAQHFFGFDHNLAITSFSVSQDTLRTLSGDSGFDAVDPWEVAGEIGGCCVASTEMVNFTSGNATVSSFSPTDIETLGQPYLGTSRATWLTLTSLISGNKLPVSRTMRRTRWQEPGYLRGDIVHVGELDQFRTLRQPAGLEVLRALARDWSLKARVSTPGKAAENLIRACDADLSMFVYEGVTSLCEQLTRRGSASLVKRRLDQFLNGSDVMPGDQRYDALSARLDEALGAPELDETGYMNFNRIKQILNLTPKQTGLWVDWAVRHRLILRGVEARCKNCKHAQWRPLADAVPDLVCHGCGLPIDTPFGSQKIDHQYRASEILLRAASHDVLPAVLAIRHLSQIFDRSDGTIFGAYPGIEILELDANDPSAELDVIVVLANGKWLVGECKMRERGLKETDLQKLWAAADRVGAPATFAATLDRGSACSDVWRRTTDPNGRPHFALTAGHLYDLAAFGPVYGEELFGWRDDLVQLPPDAETSQGDFMRKAFGDYLVRRSDDPSKYPRAPWDEDEDE